MYRYGGRAVLLLLGGVLVLGLVALALAIVAGSSEAQQDSMHNCPQAGKWAISVWDGDDGTDAGEALATCGDGVAYAYYIDPDTQDWLRWFAARPDPGVSNLRTLDSMQAVLAYGAVSAAQPTPTPTPTLSPSPTATEPYTFTFPSFYGEPDTFRGAVQETRMMDSIPGGDFYPAVTPPEGGKFAVVLMTVTNIGNEGANVGSFSFRLRDDQGRLFTMGFAESFSAQLAAEGYFDRLGLYDTVMPGITLDTVFVFLVPQGTTGLVAERCPDSGC